MSSRLPFVGAALVLAVASAGPARAGVLNPDISVVGQPFARWTDAAADPARKRVLLDVGETELVFDAYLNPYARGTFVFALGEEGIEPEEAYFQLQRGLPAGLALKGGKYRLGFGKLNPSHLHALPFAERFRVLESYLPGEESFNETAVQLSALLPLAGETSLTASADWLQGGGFRLEREPSGAPNDPLAADAENGDRQTEPRPGGLARLSLFAPIGERSGFELGCSGARGTGNVAAASRTSLLGLDAKLKLWTGPLSYLVLQSEVLHLDREEAGWDEAAAAYALDRVTSTGGYLFADWNWNTRYNAGAAYERWQEADAAATWNQGFRLFAGLALMEETTAFRIDWEHLKPGRPDGASEDPEAVNAITLRVVYSMGPHKAHTF